MKKWDYDRRAMRQMYQALLPGLQRAAQQCGYALAVHGSMARDLDLIALPWVATAEDPAELAFRLAVSCHGLLVGQTFDTPNRRLFHINMPWRESENRNYIELSVTPNTTDLRVKTAHENTSRTR